MFRLSQKDSIEGEWIVFKGGAYNIRNGKDIEDKVDSKDSQTEGSNTVYKRYHEIGQPYMRDYSISPIFLHQFIMTPLMYK